MGKLVTLDELEEYEREERRAHAENRAPALAHPQEVFAETLGNADSLLKELSPAEQNAATRKLHRERKADQANDERLKGIIRGNVQRQPQGEGSTGAYQAPDPSRYDGPKSKSEKDYADRQVEGLMSKGANFDDSFSDSNIPNTEKGLVLGDSVNRKFTRKMMTSSDMELIQNNERNSVPVPDRFRNDNPPQVIQQSNPLDGTPPTPVSGEYPHVATNNDDEVKNNPGPNTDPTVPHTAISVPYPEHVIGDETGTTREPTRENETDTKKAKAAPKTPPSVPITESQVFQGAIKRPDTMDSGRAALPADTPTGVDGETARGVKNSASKAAKKVQDEAREAALKDEVDRDKQAVKARAQAVKDENRKK